MAAVFDTDTDLNQGCKYQAQQRSTLAFFDDHVVAFHNGWKFVNIHTDMAEAVIEILTIASFSMTCRAAWSTSMSCDAWL